MEENPKDKWIILCKLEVILAVKVLTTYVHITFSIKSPIANKCYIPLEPLDTLSVTI